MSRSRTPVPHLGQYLPSGFPTDETEFFRAVAAMASELGQDCEETDTTEAVTAENFVSSTVTRFEEMESRKKEKLESLRNERLQEELSVLQDRPSVNPRPAKVQSELPLHQRLQVELRKRDARLRQLQKTLESERKRKEAEECTFAPKVLRPKQQPATSVSFVTRSQAWLERKNQANAKKQEMLKLEETVGCTSRPKINPVSVKLAEKSPRRCERDCRTPEPRSSRPETSPHFRRILGEKTLSNANRPLPIPKNPQKSIPISEISFSESLQFALTNCARIA